MDTNNRIDAATALSQWTATASGSDILLRNSTDGSAIDLIGVTGFGTDVNDYLV